MNRKNAPKRRRRNPRLIIDAVPTGLQHDEPCEQCRIAGKRIRFAITIKEAQTIADALNGTDAQQLGSYFQAHVTIATRRDPYDEY